MSQRRLPGLRAQSRRGDPAELRPFGGQSFQGFAAAAAADAEGAKFGVVFMESNYDYGWGWDF